MPLGFPPLHPEGMGESSPGFQPWVCESRDLSPEGTVDPCCLSRPFGTGAEARLLTSCKTQILVAWDRNVRAPIIPASPRTLRASGHGL
jgi:hypothetical protein